jgi:hypothetical protein
MIAMAPIEVMPTVVTIDRTPPKLEKVSVLAPRSEERSILSAWASIQTGRMAVSRPSALIVVRPLIISPTNVSRVCVDSRSSELALDMTAEDRQAIIT